MYEFSCVSFLLWGLRSFQARGHSSLWSFNFVVSSSRSFKLAFFSAAKVIGKYSEISKNRCDIFRIYEKCRTSCNIFTSFPAFSLHFVSRRSFSSPLFLPH